MANYNIALLPGDGTGPEVLREGVKVAQAAAQRFGFSFDTTEYDFGGDRFLRTGEVLPDSATEELKKYDAIFLGAIGHPDVKPGILEKGILLRVRFDLDQYINLRPVKLYPNVETPLKNKGRRTSTSWSCARTRRTCIQDSARYAEGHAARGRGPGNWFTTRNGVDRCLRYAFETARKRNKTKTLLLCGKRTFDVRVRPVGTRVPRDGRAGLPGYQARIRARRRDDHVDGQESRMVRRHRDQQHVRRYHHGPRRDDPGRHGHRPPAATSTRRACPCSSLSAAAPRNTPARTSSIRSRASSRGR